MFWMFTNKNNGEIQYYKGKIPSCYYYSCCSVTLRVPPPPPLTGWTKELWSNCFLLILIFFKNYQKWAKTAGRRPKKAWAEGQSPPQELKVGPRSGLYLLVHVIFYDGTKVSYFSRQIWPKKVLLFEHPTKVFYMIC